MQMTDIYIPGLHNGLYCYNPGVMYASVTDISADEVMLSSLFLACLSVCLSVCLMVSMHALFMQQDFG